MYTPQLVKKENSKFNQSLANHDLKNNANEAVGFTPQNITTEDDFVAFVRYVMPQLNNKQVQELLAHYPLPEDLSTARFATDGLNDNATAVFVSPWAVGQQQRANVIIYLPLFVSFNYSLAEIESLCGNNICLFCVLAGGCIQPEWRAQL